MSGSTLGSPQTSCRLTNSTVQSIPSASFTALTFDTELPTGNMSGMWSAVNPTRITIPRPGLYIVGFHCFTNSASAGSRRVGRIFLNGATSIVDQGEGGAAGFGTTGSHRYGASTVRQFAASDFIEAQIFQDSGGALSTSGGATPEDTPIFYAAML